MRFFRDISKFFAVLCCAVMFGGIGLRVLADCSAFGLPFTDLGSTSFCAQIAEAYYTGLTNGTGATAYSPTQNVPREQMAAFVTRTLDKSLSRGSRRAALQQFWTTTPEYANGLGTVTVGSGGGILAQSDGENVWVPFSTSVYGVHTTDGKVTGPWTGATGAYGVVVAMGKVFISGSGSPGALFMIDPSAAPTAVTTVSSSLGDVPNGLTFDGQSIWTANESGSVSKITPTGVGTWSVGTVSTGGGSAPRSAIFDGQHVWVSDAGVNHALLELDSAGAILKTVTVGQSPGQIVFDGTNIWAPNFDNSVSVVRVSDGLVVATLTGNGLNQPAAAAFDGQRVLVTNSADSSVSLFQATSLAPIGHVATGLPGIFGACSDGRDFWIVSTGTNKIARF